jgi:hypothetical protein
VVTTFTSGEILPRGGTRQRFGVFEGAECIAECTSPQNAARIAAAMNGAETLMKQAVDAKANSPYVSPVVWS